MSKDSNERKVLRSVFPLPCSSSSFPIESLSVKVETDCDQSKNMFARFFSGACGSSRNGFSHLRVPSSTHFELRIYGSWSKQRCKKARFVIPGLYRV